jgi:hypothetical protein
VDQKKHADGKNEHEWTAEKAKVQMKISNEPAESPSHLAGALSESEKQSLPWKDFA